jgi:DNA-binding transcriptional ArsR family regulator
MGEAGMTAPAVPGAGYQLQVDAPGTLAVSVVLAPHQSVVSLLLQAASGQPRGAPAGLLAAICRTLRPQARFAVQPFATRGAVSVPDFCTPILPLNDTSVAEQARRLREMDVGVLTDELLAAGDCDHFARWRIAGHQPRRWLNSMADASLDTWSVMEPYWRAAGPLFDREVRRVGTAAVRGALGALLNSLHPRISYACGTLAFAFPHDRCAPLRRRRLALVPMIAGRDALFVNFEADDVCYIGYPVRQPATGPPAATNGTLALVLGPVRAAALRALRQPLAVGELAVAVQCAPTTATYHVHLLAAAGLVTCERRGSSVLVSRSVRGHELVDLLAD